VLVPNYNSGFALRAAQLLELKAISDQTDVAFVWMEKVDGPILSRLAVVPKRSHSLEL